MASLLRSSWFSLACGLTVLSACSAESEEPNPGGMDATSAVGTATSGGPANSTSAASGPSASSTSNNSSTSAASTTSATASTSTSGGNSGGVLIGGVCTLLCSDDSTDADGSGVSDGWGFEAGQSCVVPGGAVDTGEPCSDPVLAEGPDAPSAPGSGVLVNGACQLVCMGGSTDADASGMTDGWGFERGTSCIVPGSPADPGIEMACDDPPMPPSSEPGGMVEVDGTCYPVCADDSTDADEDGAIDGWGYENEMSCIVPAGEADTGIPCGE